METRIASIKDVELLWMAAKCAHKDADGFSEALMPYEAFITRKKADEYQREADRLYHDIYFRGPWPR